MQPTSPLLAAGIAVHCAHHRLVSIHELKPRPGNPNEHPESQIILYAAAIQARGWREAITVSNLSGFIVAGHGALLAARKLGVDVVPVEFQDYGGEDEELADLLAHNRLPELSRTDKDLLTPILQRLAPGGFALSAGYGAEVIAKLLAEVAPAAHYPLVAKLNEAHHLLCIPVDSETDWQFLKNLVGARVEQSFKNTTVGESHVVPFARFIHELRMNLGSLSPASSLCDDPPPQPPAIERR